MARYIDADNLIKKMQEQYNNLLNDDGYYDHFTQGYEEALSTVENEPTADVQEVRHGRWIRATTYGSYTCSICGAMDTDCDDYPCYGNYRVLDQQYCSRCGAKMDLEENV